MPRAFLGKRVFVAPLDRPASAREHQARALGRAFLPGAFGVDGVDPDAAGLHAVLADPAPRVRRALAEALAGAPGAPRDMILTLARDVIGVSLPVLARSPVLTDKDLIDCAARGDVAVQTAIALRKSLSPAVAGALAEVGGRPTAMALAVNAGANLPEFSLLRLAERFPADGQLREALLSRAWVPASLRVRLTENAARQLTEGSVARHWLSPERSEHVFRESRHRAIMTIAAACAATPSETAGLVAYLRGAGLLTAHLALRALLCGERALFVASLVELAGVSRQRVAAMLEAPDRADFAELYEAAQMPDILFPAFYAALYALNAFLAPQNAVAPGELRAELVTAALELCESIEDEAMAPALILLRRFAGEVSGEVSGQAFGEASWPDAASRASDQAALPDQAFSPDLAVDLDALERELRAA